MSDNIDVFVISEDIRKPTGFATNGRLVCYALAADHDVACLSETADSRTTTTVRGRDVTLLPVDRDPTNQAYGGASAKARIEEYDPSTVVSLMNLRMVQYLPRARLPVDAKIVLRDLGQDDYHFPQLIEAAKRSLAGLPDEPAFEWVAQIPVDGHPLPAAASDYLKEIDRVVAMSDYGAGVLADHGVDAPVIPHAVDVPDSYPSASGMFDDDAFVVGSVNANDYRKQGPRLLEAWGKFYDLAGRPDDVVFYLHTGREGPEGWDLDDYAKKYGIHDAMVPYAGTVSRRQLHAIYSDFDVFASATAGEGFGLTAVEAMYHGTPVVLTDYTTSAEFVGADTSAPRGSLADVAAWYDAPQEQAGVERALVDTDVMANHLMRYYDDADARRRHGDNARDHVRRHYDFDAVAETWRSFV